MTGKRTASKASAEWRRRVGGIVFVFVAVAAVALSGCSDLIAPIEPALRAGRMRFDYGADTLTDAEKSDVVAALSYLYGSPYASQGYSCAWSGSVMSLMLDYGQIRKGDQTVNPQAYGYSDGSGNIYITPLGFSSGRLASTLAEEFSHAMLGFHHPGNPYYSPYEDAGWFAADCEQPYN